MAYAGFWRRLGAHTIDVALLFIVDGFLIFSVYGKNMLHIHPVISGFITVLTIAYNVYFLSSKWQATIGKRIMNVYVVTADGRRLSAKDALIRYIASIGPALLLTLMPVIAGGQAAIPPGLSEADQQRYTALENDIMHMKKISDQDAQFLDSLVARRSPADKLLGLLSGLYTLVLCVTVGITREKTGIHDMMCKTRALKGRPQGT